jgi:hypothetical protein
MPADFGSFESIRDLSVPRNLAYGRPQADLDARDPQRQLTGDPRALFDLDIDSDGDGRVRYELWPRLLTARQFPVLYRQRPQAFALTDNLPGVLFTRPDVIEAGALVEAALWPGPSPAQRNPYFVLGLHDRLAEKYARKVQSLSLRDDDQANKSYQDAPTMAGIGYADTEQLRASDATLDDYI